MPAFAVHFASSSGFILGWEAFKLQPGRGKFVAPIMLRNLRLQDLSRLQSCNDVVPRCARRQSENTAQCSVVAIQTRIESLCYMSA